MSTFQQKSAWGGATWAALPWAGEEPSGQIITATAIGQGVASANLGVTAVALGQGVASALVRMSATARGQGRAVALVAIKALARGQGVATALIRMTALARGQGVATAHVFFGAVALGRGVAQASVVLIPTATAIGQGVATAIVLFPIQATAIGQGRAYIGYQTYGGGNLAPGYDVGKPVSLRFAAWPQPSMPICYIYVKPQYKVIPANASTQIENNMNSQSESDPQFGQ